MKRKRRIVWSALAAVLLMSTGIGTFFALRHTDKPNNIARTEPVARPAVVATITSLSGDVWVGDSDSPGQVPGAVWKQPEVKGETRSFPDNATDPTAEPQRPVADAKKTAHGAPWAVGRSQRSI